MFRHRLGLPLMVYFLSRSVHTFYEYLSSRWINGIRISILGFALVSTIFMSQCGRPAARDLLGLTHLLFPPSYPICCLHGLRGNFCRILYHRLGLNLVSFIPSCLWGVALEPFHCRVFRRFVDIRRCFRFRSDKFYQRSWQWSGKLLWGGSCGATYSGSYHNDLFQSHHRIPGDYLWSLQEHYWQGSPTQGLSPSYAWEEVTDLYESTITWQSSMLYVSLVFPNIWKLYFD